MKETITVKAEPRTTTGSSNAGRSRRGGKVPAVVYTEGKPAEMIQLDAHDFSGVLRKHHGEHMIMDVVVGGGAPRKMLLKEVQHHPVGGQPIHADFYAVNMSRKLKVEIPVRLTGIPVGVSGQGGILDHLLRAVQVECLPGDLMEEVVLDVSALELGKHLSVSNIQLDPAKYRMLTPVDVAIAAVSAPPTEEEVAAEAAEGAAGEPEVLTEKKPAEGEEGEAPAKGEKGAAPAKGEKGAAASAKGGEEKAPKKEAKK